MKLLTEFYIRYLYVYQKGKHTRICRVAAWATFWLNIQKGLRWMERCEEEINYFLSQFLTSRDYYRSNVYRFGHHNWPAYRKCEDELEDAEQVIFSCRRFETYDRPRLGCPGLFGRMTDKADAWSIVSNFATKMRYELHQLREDELEASRTIR